MKILFVLLAFMSTARLEAQPCPLVQDTVSTEYGFSIGVIGLPLKWIMNNLECVDDRYVITTGKIFINNGTLVLGLIDESDTWMDFILLNEENMNVSNGTYENDVLPELGSVFSIKIKIKTNLDLSRYSYIYYSDDYEIGADNYYLNNP